AIVARVDVHRIGVALPDLDGGVANRRPRGPEDAAGEVSDLTHGRGDLVVNDEQVVVCVEREFVRIEGAFGEGGRTEQLVGEQPAGGEERRAQGTQEEAATANFHRVSQDRRLLATRSAGRSASGSAPSPLGLWETRTHAAPGRRQVVKRIWDS